MSDDRRVTRRSKRECRDIAARTKTFYVKERRWPVNIRKILNSGKIQTLRGERALVYDVVDDHLLGDKDATTELVNGVVKITAKRSVDQKADWGGRARMTLAHELGHGVMHASEGVVDNRVSGTGGTTELSKTRASESAEHQAKVFASAFLIDDERALELESPEDISMEFLVSFEAAEICYERLQAQVEKAASAARVMKLNNEFQASMRPQPKKPNFLEIPCVSCKEATLIPIGTKVLCDSCGYVGDHPQSGDPAG
jgi:ribosomal protein S27E